MPAGFFHESVLLGKPAVSESSLPLCSACGLYKTCRTPKMPATGGGRRRVLIVGETPSDAEDAGSGGFSGPSADLLRTALARANVDLDRDCWRTNSLICRPPNGETPTDEQIDYCRPNLYRTVADLRPTVIVPLGGPAVKSVMWRAWKTGDVGGINRWRGFRIPSTVFNAWILPTLHPAFVLREIDKKNPVVRKIWEADLGQISAVFDAPPHDPVPDYAAAVRAVSPDEAVVWLGRFAADAAGIAAFDYETDRLKPDAADATILSCAVCWRGRQTIAYPWTKKTAAATETFLKSPIAKVAANAKFENRWTAARLGFFPRNVVWDTVLAAHILDNRRDVTGVKFQSFVNLGVPAYSEHIESAMRTGPDGKTNRLRQEVSGPDLLKYNGLDALYEYKIAEIQTAAANHPVHQLFLEARKKWKPST